MNPKMLLSFTLGTLSAIGGFIDIGDLVTDAQVGARFGLRLAWVTGVAVVGIACFSEMAGRVAIATRSPAFSAMRSRLGPRYALGGLAGSLGVTVLLVMAELSGVGLALQIATSVHYLAWVPVAAVLVAVLVWTISFEHMEQAYGLLGLAMLVYVVAVWQLGPDWVQLAQSATTLMPTPGETWAVYAFYAVALVGAQMTPYEMYFFSSGAIESRWTRKNLTEMRVNVLVGFPLGGLLAIAIQAVAYLVFYEAGIQVEHLSQTVLPVAVALGKVGLVIAIVGVFAATFGATLETLFATGYDIAQYFGWSYGEVQPPVKAARFTVVMMLILLAATAFALTAVNPITVTIFAVVCSAALLPFAFLPVLLVANDRELMGDLVNGRLSNVLGTATLVFSSVIAVIAIPLLVWTRAGG
ncbi:NRAMP family divalent metal transporter [Nocardioides sp. SYSU DS0651]|uniref:NRAMP family divalent metal transporter n=1 Tax=Nocardioides sp. SYSU DS0651 TaxID=3415955 RepID=UPI003F4C3D8F